MPKHTISLYGPIDETNYLRVMESARRDTDADTTDIPYASMSENYASRFGINIKALQTKTGIDLRCLFGILRTDTDPGNMNYHGSQSDQALFMEALCMLGEDDSAKYMLAKHELASLK